MLHSHAGGSEAVCVRPQVKGSSETKRFCRQLCAWLNLPNTTSDSQTCARQAARRARARAGCHHHLSLRYPHHDLTAVSLCSDKASDKASNKDLGLDDEGKLTLSNLANDRFARAVRLFVACHVWPHCCAARSLNVHRSSAPARRASPS